MATSPGLRDQAQAIFLAALKACSIEAAFARKLSTPTLDGVRLLSFNPAGESPHDPSHNLPLSHLRQIRIVAAGKASSEMLRALLLRLPSVPGCSIEGVLIARDRPNDLPPGFQFFPGGHPLPTQGSFDGARAALHLFAQPPSGTPSETLCLSLISGGASAMMELPLDSAISLEDTVAFHRALVHSSASITEINCVRKHFSAIKGGRLALAAGPSATLSLLVSDVPPGHLDALASGPTLPDSSTVDHCRHVLSRRNLTEHFPASVRSFFDSPDLPETPKSADLHAPSWTLLDSADLARAAQAEAQHLGFRTVLDNTCDDWDYKDAARYLLDRLRSLRRDHPGQRLCLLSTGEVIVHVNPQANVHVNVHINPQASIHINPQGDLQTNLQATPHQPSPTRDPQPHGTGGRNQQIALTLATLLEPADAPIAILSAGSDGIDGNSQAAGALLDHTTLAAQPDRDAARHALDRFDTTPFLGQHHATLITGPTGNNLRDLRILLTQ